MFGFHRPKVYRSMEGCCICRAKSSSSRFTHSQRYERDFKSCFGLGEVRYGDICNACVLLVKRWKKLPAGSKKNWNHVVDARGGTGLKTTAKKMMMRRRRKDEPRGGRLAEKHLKTLNSDAHSTSSTSPAQSPSYSNQSDDGSDTEPTSGPAHSPAFTFLDLTYWKRQRVCCGIVYAGRYGEVLIDPQLYKPCCRKLPTQEEEQKQEEEQEDEATEEEEQEDEEDDDAHIGPGRPGSSHPPQVKQEVSVIQEVSVKQEVSIKQEVSMEDVWRQDGEEWC